MVTVQLPTASAALLKHTLSKDSLFLHFPYFFPPSSSLSFLCFARGLLPAVHLRSPRDVIRAQLGLKAKGEEEDGGRRDRMRVYYTLYKRTTADTLVPELQRYGGQHPPSIFTSVTGSINIGVLA